MTIEMHKEDARRFLTEANFHYVLAYIVESYMTRASQEDKTRVMEEEFENTVDLIVERIPAGELYEINQKIDDPATSDGYRDQLQASVLSRLHR